MLPIMALTTVPGWRESDPKVAGWNSAVNVIMTGVLFFYAFLFGDMCRGHFQRAYQNMTSVEYHYKNMLNPYDLGGWRHNLPQVMGEFGLDWFLPILPWRPL